MFDIKWFKFTTYINYLIGIEDIGFVRLLYLQTYNPFTGQRSERGVFMHVGLVEHLVSSDFSTEVEGLILESLKGEGAVGVKDSEGNEGTVYLSSTTGMVTKDEIAKMDLNSRQQLGLKLRYKGLHLEGIKTPPHQLALKMLKSEYLWKTQTLERSQVRLWRAAKGKWQRTFTSVLTGEKVVVNISKSSGQELATFKDEGETLTGGLKVNDNKGKWFTWVDFDKLPPGYCNQVIETLSDLIVKVTTEE